MKQLTPDQLLQANRPLKRNDAGQIIIPENQPSAVSAHAMLKHNKMYDCSVGALSAQRKEDRRKFYKALACKEIDHPLIAAWKVEVLFQSVRKHTDNQKYFLSIFAF